MSLSVRLGQKKVENKILPVVDHILKYVFEEDLFVIETLKLCNLLAALRLLKQEQCEEMLALILPYTMHPNRQIRESVVKYIVILATLGHADSASLVEPGSREETTMKKINFSKGPLYSSVEFYAKIRPKLLNYLKEDAQGRRDIIQVKSVQDLLQRLRPPLALRKFLKCLKDPTEIQRPQTPDDKFAMEALSKMITNKLKQRSRAQPDARNKLSLKQQQRPRNKYYRLIKANALANLMGLDIFNMFSSLTGHPSDKLGNSKVQCKYQKDLHFEPTQLIPDAARESVNFGLSKPLGVTDHLMTPEMQNVVDALELHRDQTALKYQVQN